MILTYRYRVKNLHGELRRQARAVNFIWNYCNDVQKHALTWGQKWPGGKSLSYMTAGSSIELGLSSYTVAAVGDQYARSRRQHRRPWLRYRGKKSLGWVPIKGQGISRHGDGFRFYGKIYRVFYSRPLPEGKIRDGSSFSQDARGNWHLNIVVEVPDVEARPIADGVGIDLGLKEFATLSTGEAIPNPRHFISLEKRLATAQRAKKRPQAANIHAKIGNARRDFLHKLSTRIVREFDHIAVGDVNAAGLAKTSRAKSVTDAGWSSFRLMLAYKSVRDGAWYEEVSERFTTQVCSSCGTLPHSRPKGIADLGIRAWTCSDCGVVHDRDVNAAKNILLKSGLRSGHRAPVEGARAA